MARIRSVLGVIEGSAGSLTFASTPAGNIMRQKVGRNSSNTVAQQTQRNKFAELSTLYNKLQSLIRIGLPKLGTLSPFNRFVQINNDFMSVDADLVASIDYSKMVLSRGNVEPVEGLAATKADAASSAISVSHTNNSNGGSALSSDVIAYAVVNKSTNVTELFPSSTLRQTNIAATLTRSSFAGVDAASLVVYAFARRADDSQASPTTYDEVQ